MESKSLKTNKRLLLKGILLVALSTIILTLGEFFLKKGALVAGNTLWSFINTSVLFGLILYGLATILFVVGLKYGDLSALYPILGLSYVWVVLISFFFFKEAIFLVDIIGIIFIVSGVAIIGVTDLE